MNKFNAPVFNNISRIGLVFIVIVMPPSLLLIYFIIPMPCDYGCNVSGTQLNPQPTMHLGPTSLEHNRVLTLVHRRVVR